MLVFAHHMGVEFLGREYSPHGFVQHLCVFAALGLVAATSAYGTWMLAVQLLERSRAKPRTEHRLE